MIEPLSLLLSPILIFISLGIFAVIYTIRAILEFKFTSLVDNKWYQHIFLPLSPIFLGANLWIVPGLPIPEGLSSIAGRIIFGAVAGLLSGIIYKVIIKGLALTVGDKDG